MAGTAIRGLFGLALGIDAALLGGLVLNTLSPVVGQGLAGGAIVVFRGLTVGLVATPLGFLLYPRLPAKLARWLLYLLGIPALLLLVLLALGLRQSKLEQSAHLATQIAALPPFELYLANSARVGDAPFIDIQFDSSAQRYFVRYSGHHDCHGDLPPTSAQKLQLLQSLRSLEAIMLNQPLLCHAQASDLLHSLDFTIHDYQPPHLQYTLQVDQACLEKYPAITDAIEQISAVQQHLKHSEQCQ